MKNYITEKKGLMSWLFTLDHKRIGIMYLVSIFAAFAIGICCNFIGLNYFQDKILLTATI